MQMRSMCSCTTSLSAPTCCIVLGQQHKPYVVGNDIALSDVSALARKLLRTTLPYQALLLLPCCTGAAVHLPAHPSCQLVPSAQHRAQGHQARKFAHQSRCNLSLCQHCPCHAKHSVQHCALVTGLHKGAEVHMQHATTLRAWRVVAPCTTGIHALYPAAYTPVWERPNVFLIVLTCRSSRVLCWAVEAMRLWLCSPAAC